MRSRGCASCWRSRRPRTSKNSRQRGPRLEARASSRKPTSSILRTTAAASRGLDGKAVFIDGALPGERVRFRVLEAPPAIGRGGSGRGAGAPRPIAPCRRCAHFGVCGGCSLQHLVARGAARRQSSVSCSTICERIGSVRPQRVLAPLRGPDWAYRRRARLGVKYVHKKGRVLAGFREREKPYLADIQRCEVLLERFATLPAGSGRAGRDPDAARETAASRGRRRETSERRWCFGSWRRRAPEIWSKLAAFAVAARACRSSCRRAASTRCGRCRIAGATAPLALRSRRRPDHARIRACRFHPGQSRDQRRHGGARRSSCCSRSRSDTVLDLFCGLGNFTLPLARRAARASSGVEGDAALVAKARANALRNGIGNADFVVDNLFEPAALRPLGRASLRSGAARPAARRRRCDLERMPQWRPRRVVYISCHPGSLARDAGSWCSPRIQADPAQG